MKKAMTAWVLAAAGLAAGCQNSVLFVASYDETDPATRTTLDAFRSALAANDRVSTRVEVFEIKANVDSTPSMSQGLGEIARMKVQRSAAKIIVCHEEVALREVAGKLLTQDLGLVVCGLRADPADYGFEKSRNIVGVRGTGSLAACEKLAKAVAPSATRLAILGDKGPLTTALAAAARRQKPGLLKVTAVETVETQAAWMDALGRLQDEADVILVGGMEHVLGEDGEPVSPASLAAATANAARVPTVGVTRESVMDGGLLLACAPDPATQGRAAAGIVAQVLEGESIEAIFPRFRDVPCSNYVNLALAQKLGISVPPNVVKEAAGVVQAGESAPVTAPDLPAAAPAEPPK